MTDEVHPDYVERMLARRTLIYTRSEYERLAAAYLHDHELLLRTLEAAKILSQTGTTLLDELKEAERELYYRRFPGAVRPGNPDSHEWLGSDR